MNALNSYFFSLPLEIFIDATDQVHDFMALSTNNL